MKQGIRSREQGVGGFRMVRKPGVRVETVMGARSVVRDGTTGRVLAMPERRCSGKVIHLPRVWAVAEGVGLSGASLETPISESRPVRLRSGRAPELAVPTHDDETVMNGPPSNVPELAFYRRYTEAMLRRYLRLSMAAGRVPSLLGRELFRGNVTSYRVNSFEDVVIFCHDIEKLLGRLTGSEKELVKRVALQNYSQGEAALLLGISHRSCTRQYALVLDRLTKMLMEAGMLDPQKCCQ